MSSLVIWTEHKDDFSQAPCVETGVDQALLYLRMVDMPAHFSVGCVMIDDDRLQLCRFDKLMQRPEKRIWFSFFGVLKES